MPSKFGKGGIQKSISQEPKKKDRRRTASGGFNLQRGMSEPLYPDGLEKPIFLHIGDVGDRKEEDDDMIEETNFKFNLF